MIVRHNAEDMRWLRYLSPVFRIPASLKNLAEFKRVASQAVVHEYMRVELYPNIRQVEHMLS